MFNRFMRKATMKFKLIYLAKKKKEFLLSLPSLKNIAIIFLIERLTGLF